MLKTKEKWLKPLRISSWIFIIISALSLIYFEDIFDNFLNRNILFFVLIYLSLFIIIFLFTSIFNMNRRFEIRPEKIIKTNNFLWFKTSRIYYVSSNDLIIDSTSNIILDILYTPRVRFYSMNKKKILDTYLTQEEMKVLLNETYSIKSDKKQPFKRSNAHYQSTKDYLSILFNTINEILLSFLIIGFILNVFKITDIKLSDISLPIWEFLLLLSIEAFLFIALIRIIRQMRLDFDINDKTLSFSKGRLFKRECFISREHLAEMKIVSGPFDKLLGVIRISIKKTPHSTLNIRIKDINLINLTGEEIKKDGSPKKKNYYLFLIELILLIISSIGFYFISFSCSILFFLSGLFFIINGHSFERTVEKDEMIILFMGLYYRRVRIIKKSHIVTQSFKRLNKDSYLYRIKTKEGTYSRFIKRIEYYSLKD